MNLLGDGSKGFVSTTVSEGVSVDVSVDVAVGVSAESKVGA